MNLIKNLRFAPSRAGCAVVEIRRGCHNKGSALLCKTYPINTDSACYILCHQILFGAGVTAEKTYDEC